MDTKIDLMNRSILTHILIGVCLLSCGEEQKSWKAEDKEKMAGILFDVHTAQVIVDRASPSQRDSLNESLWQQIEQLHGMTQSEIQEILQEMKSNPEVMKEILNRVEQKVDTIKNHVIR